jgi:hypothetical protein
MSAFNVLNAAIRSRLSADGSLGTLLGGTALVFFQQAPDTQAYPFVVWNYMGGGDENITPSRMKNLMINVMAYGTVSAANVGTIDKRIDALLHNYTFTVTGWNNFWTAREEDINLVDNPQSGNKVFSAGGIYRIRLGD